MTSKNQEVQLGFDLSRSNLLKQEKLKSDLTVRKIGVIEWHSLLVPTPVYEKGRCPFPSTSNFYLQFTFVAPYLDLLYEVSGPQEQSIICARV